MGLASKASLEDLRIGGRVSSFVCVFRARFVHGDVFDVCLQPDCIGHGIHQLVLRSYFSGSAGTQSGSSSKYFTLPLTLTNVCSLQLRQQSLPSWWAMK